MIVYFTVFPVISLKRFSQSCFPLQNIPFCTLLTISCLKNIKREIHKWISIWNQGCINFKRKLADGNLIKKWVKREFDVAVFIVRGISPRKGFSVVNFGRVPRRKRLKQSTFIFGIQINIEVFYKLIISIWVCVTKA